MFCNGVIPHKNNKFEINASGMEILRKNLWPEAVTFFGPSLESSYSFFSDQPIDSVKYKEAFSSVPVRAAVYDIKRNDIDQAARVAYLLGGLVRTFSSYESWERNKLIDFEAKMIKLGEAKSYQSLAMATAMYLLTTQRASTSTWLENDVSKMSGAIASDTITPKRTLDLGLSQATRLKNYYNQAESAPLVPEALEEQIETVRDLPTVGAEFHIPATYQKPGFWERIALLNMSQYQPGSYVQFSRIDRGVIEIRMNPSVVPIAIANYNLLSILVPEVRNAYFTTTLNRDSGDFNWDLENKGMLENLHALGLLGYASFFENVQDATNAEIPLGGVYLGQTVKFHEGKAKFTGEWSGGLGSKGQVGIYTGYGNTFPFLAYNLSMALANPGVFDTIGDLSTIATIDDAMSVSQHSRKWIFDKISESVMKTPHLRNAHESGRKLIEILKY